MRPSPSFSPVAFLVVALLAGCGSDLPKIPTEPTWTTSSTASETTEATSTTVVASTSTEPETEVGVVPLTRRITPVARPPVAPPSPTTTSSALPTTTASRPATTTTTARATTTTPTTTRTTVFFRDCDAARSAGAAPLHRGDPGYRSGLDRDGDGIACEPKPR